MSQPLPTPSRFILAVAAAILMWCAGCATTAPEPEATASVAAPVVDPHTWNVETYALLVGNGSYQPGWKPLPGAVTDVQDVARALERNGVRTEVFTNLTRELFERVLADFFFKHGDNENHHLLVYIAGHGFTEKLVTDELMGSLVLADTPRPEVDLAGFRQRSLPMTVFEELSPKVRSRHVLFMFDVCFSGAIFDNAAAPSPPGTVDEVQRRLALPVRQFITSGNRTDAVPDYSQFKQILVNFLTVEGAEPHRDGYLTGTEIGDYLARTLPKGSNPQHPQYGTLRDSKLNQGDFVLRLDPSIAPPPPGSRLPVAFHANRNGATIYVDQVKMGKIQGGRLALHLPPGTHHLMAKNYLSTDRPIERMIEIANVWTQQIFELHFESGAPPPPP
jgi:hypothetical protein